MVSTSKIRKNNDKKSIYPHLDKQTVCKEYQREYIDFPEQVKNPNKMETTDDTSDILMSAKHNPDSKLCNGETLKNTVDNENVLNTFEISNSEISLNYSDDGEKGEVEGPAENNSSANLSLIKDSLPDKIGEIVDRSEPEHTVPKIIKSKGEVFSDPVKESEGSLHSDTNLDKKAITENGNLNSGGKTCNKASVGLPLDGQTDSDKDNSVTDTELELPNLSGSANVTQENPQLKGGVGSSVSDNLLNNKQQLNNESGNSVASTLPISNTSIKEPEPVKVMKKQKARKSCHSSGSGYSSTASTMSNSPPKNTQTKINIASFAKKTIKVTELESVLGLQASSLNKMDAKTLDKLVLQKAKQHQNRSKDGISKIVSRPVSIVPPSKVITQGTVDVNTTVKSISPSSRIKDSVHKTSNQLITQFMVKKSTPEISPNAQKLEVDRINESDGDILPGVQKQYSETNDIDMQCKSPNVEQQQQENVTHTSGVSAVITSHLLLNKSKKKRKNYKGRSGAYRLPGERTKKVKRRDSTDDGIPRQQEKEEESFGDISNGELVIANTDGDTSQNDSQYEDSVASDSLPAIKRKYKKRASTGVVEKKQEEDIPTRRKLRNTDSDKGNDEGNDKDTTEVSTLARRSSRKRKMTVIFADDSDSTIPTEMYDAESDWSDSDKGEKALAGNLLVSTEDESVLTDDSDTDHTQDCQCCRNISPTASMNKKRRKMSQEDDQAEDDGATLPNLSPVKPLQKVGNSDTSPPKISPRPIVPIPQYNEIKMEEKKPMENATVAHEVAATQPFKYMNTPNGMSYPVTPPETPESTISSIDDSKVVSMADRDKEGGISPVCFCRLPGTTFKNVKPLLYCQALDSFEGKVNGCMNKVSNNLVLRPSSRIPFLALCDSHRQRLKGHQCCPGCGHYCTQGTFYQCKESSNHHYHRHCQVLRDDKYFCPHCGEQSCQIEIHVDAAHTKGSLPIKLDKKAHIGNARMGASPSTRRVSTDSVQSRHSEHLPEEPIKTLLSMKTVNNKEIKIKNVPMGVNKKELEILVQQMQCEEKRKKFRASNKNLYQAAKSGDLERVVYLLCEGFDPNAKFEDQNQQSALHVAASNGFLAIVHLLTQAGASPHVIDEDLRTPLMEASEHGHTSVVKYLLKLGAVPEARSSDGMTPLHLAAQSGAVESIKHIVQSGTINVNIKDDGGWTPMIWAAEHRHIESVRFLLDVGSDPNLRDNEDNTGLHWAVFSGSTDIAELFLNAGCDMEAANEHGDRPLHIAVRQGHYECVVLLIARGADSSARNNRSDTPLTCCFDNTSQIYMAIQVNQQLRKVASQIRRPEKLLHRDITRGKEQYPIPIVNEFDDENYPTDYLYVNDYVETTPMNINRVITSLESCECRDNCSSMFCKCARNSVRCWYTKEGLLPEEFNYTDPPLVFECNRACSCWANCQNRVIQLGINVRLQVFRAPGKGWGVRSLLDIPKGTYVCEYIGEVLSDAEADKKEDDSYLFDLDNRDSDSFCIDARQYGNVSRFINHRCEPNLSPVKVFVDHQDLRFPRICFFANKDIKAYQELGFDYGDKFWIIKYKQFTCTCDSSKCRYSKDNIQKTVEEYYKRITEAEENDD